MPGVCAIYIDLHRLQSIELGQLTDSKNIIRLYKEPHQQIIHLNL